MIDDWSLKNKVRVIDDLNGHWSIYDYKDIDILRQKIISDICEELVFPESKIITEIINKRFGVE